MTDDQIKELAKTDPLKYMEKMLEYYKDKYENDWATKIKNEQNPMYQQILKDMKRYQEFVVDVQYFEMMYGLKLKIEFTEENDA